jgi:protein gp37
MADNTHIEWTDATWNPITGCSVVSPGCTNCYAMRLAGTRLQHHPSRAGLTTPSKAGPVWNGQVRFNEDWLGQPLRWRRPRDIFVCAHSDLFHESVPDAWIDRTFGVMALAWQHTFQVLTKRSTRMRAYLTDPDRMERMLDAEIPHPTGNRPLGDLIDIGAFAKPLPNVWLGVSAEDQERFDQRAADLRETPAWIRFISFEPLLGPIRAKHGFMGFGIGDPANCTCGHGHGFDRCPNYGKVARTCHRCNCEVFRRAPGSGGIHWAIVGGENGPRPTHPDWVRRLRDDSAECGVAFFFKQWGTHAWAERVEGDPSTLTAYQAGKKAAGRLLDGVEHNAMPVAP